MRVLVQLPYNITHGFSTTEELGKAKEVSCCNGKQAFLLRADLLYQYTTTPQDQDQSLLVPDSRVFGNLVNDS